MQEPSGFVPKNKKLKKRYLSVTALLLHLKRKGSWPNTLAESLILTTLFQRKPQCYEMQTNKVTV